MGAWTLGEMPSEESTSFRCYTFMLRQLKSWRENVDRSGTMVLPWKRSQNSRDDQEGATGRVEGWLWFGGILEANWRKHAWRREESCVEFCCKWLGQWVFSDLTWKASRRYWMLPYWLSSTYSLHVWLSLSWTHASSKHIHFMGEITYTFIESVSLTSIAEHIYY